MSKTESNETVGMNIRRLRKERGMTQGALAKAADIQRETISKYESNKLTPPPYNLERIELALKVPAGTLAQKVAIAIPDTAALLRNKRLLNLLLEDYSQVIIADVVIIELSGFKNARINRYSSGQERRQKKIASQTMSMIDEYLLRYKGTGGEILEMSNPGDYPYDPSDEPDYEIIETDEAVEEPDEFLLLFREIVSCPGVYDDEDEYIRCPVCGHGLHYYNGVATCPSCESGR